MIYPHDQHGHRQAVNGNYLTVACLPQPTGEYYIRTFLRSPDGILKEVCSISGVYAKQFENSWAHEVSLREAL